MCVPAMNRAEGPIEITVGAPANGGGAVNQNHGFTGEPRLQNSCKCSVDLHGIGKHR